MRKAGEDLPCLLSSGHLLDPDSVHICLIAVRRSAVYKQRTHRAVCCFMEEIPFTTDFMPACEHTSLASISTGIQIIPPVSVLHPASCHISLSIKVIPAGNVIPGHLDPPGCGPCSVLILQPQPFSSCTHVPAGFWVFVSSGPLFPAVPVSQRPGPVGAGGTSSAASAVRILRILYKHKGTELLSGKCD